MSDVARTPSTPGSASAATTNRSRRSVRLAIAMAVGTIAHGQGSAGGMVGGDDHQATVGPRDGRVWVVRPFTGACDGTRVGLRARGSR